VEVGGLDIGILITVASSIGGASLGGIMAWHFGVRERKRQLAWDFYRRFNNNEFRHIRDSVWNASKDWDNMKSRVMDWYLDKNPEMLTNLSTKIQCPLLKTSPYSWNSGPNFS
jgi:hypothetical protein